MHQHLHVRLSLLLPTFSSTSSSSSLPCPVLTSFFLLFFPGRWSLTCMERRTSKLRLLPLRLARTRQSQINLFWMVKRTCCPKRITKLTLQCTFASGPCLPSLQLDQFCSRCSFGFKHQPSRKRSGRHHVVVNALPERGGLHEQECRAQNSTIKGNAQREKERKNLKSFKCFFVQSK